MMSEAVREMTFEEEYENLQKDAKELFKNEKDGCEPPFANCVVRKALRCIAELQTAAYDVDKVVEKLEDASYHTVSTFDEDGLSNDDSEEVVDLNVAIEIVKKGGVDET